jgi:phosphatidylglycerol:prolipoprotein diacylglycerol transferase
MFFFALLAGTLVAGGEFERQGLDRSRIYLLSAILALSGVIGARIFYVLGNLSEFRGRWTDVFDVNTVGLVYYGGLLPAVLAGYIYARRNRLPAGPVLGAYGLALPLCLAIARVGCFLNGCCGGKPSGLPWAVTFPGSSQAVHPTQLYEAVLDALLFAALFLVGRRYLAGWDMLLASLAGYSAVRFLMEFLRAHTNPDAALFFQVMSAVMFTFCVVMLALRKRRAPPREMTEG